MVVLPYSRTLAAQVVARSTRSFTRPATINSLSRVTCACANKDGQTNRGSEWIDLGAFYRRARSYATTATKPASRPKAHTGRAAAKRTTTTKKAASTSATKKPTRRTKKKTVKKPKPKVKKAPSKTALAQKARKAQSDLRAAALLEEPKQLPSTAFSLILVEESHKAGDVRSRAAAASGRYKNLSPEEREQYNHQANENRQKNAVAYKKWVQSHTPLEIKQANNARRTLVRKAKAEGKKKRFTPIHDDRSVKGHRNAYTFFFADRHASGDLKGMSVGESGKLIGKEWKELSATERRAYDSKAEADKNRYDEELKSVYGLDPPKPRTRKASS
ncbi:hypothetical protein PV11_06892 [Exophiala sideris]|uniref:HMG box domain-containing protein n=1 Tax=Exophiala sideris TaxID=1016849 RepID=A0A0D1WVW9_9EURO|nr:hypothetical protein PV11_06892 [Exophiala sideris]